MSKTFYLQLFTPASSFWRMPSPFLEIENENEFRAPEIGKNKRGIMRITKQYFVLSGVLALAACSSLPPMENPDGYSKMNCAAIAKERAAVEANQKASRDSSSTNFSLAMFGAVLEGVSNGLGLPGDAAQAHTVTTSSLDMKNQNDAEAKAFGNRIALLDQISSIRKCQQ